MAKQRGTRAVFLDRDGVINRLLTERGPKETPRVAADFELLPGVVDAIMSLKRHGLQPIIVTNQPNVAKGKSSYADYEAIEQRMHDVLGAADVLDVYVCLHHPDAKQVVVRRLWQDCACRKPKPGLILQAVADFGLLAVDCWLIGDSDTDLAAGLAAGLIPHRLIAVGSSCYTAIDGVCHLKDLPAAAQHIINSES